MFLVSFLHMFRLIMCFIGIWLSAPGGSRGSKQESIAKKKKKNCLAFTEMICQIFHGNNFAAHPQINVPCKCGQRYMIYCQETLWQRRNNHHSTHFLIFCALFSKKKNEKKRFWKIMAQTINMCASSCLKKKKTGKMPGYLLSSPHISLAAWQMCFFSFDLCACACVEHTDTRMVWIVQQVLWAYVNKWNYSPWLVSTNQLYDYVYVCVFVCLCSNVCCCELLAAPKAP